MPPKSSRLLGLSGPAGTASNSSLPVVGSCLGFGVTAVCFSGGAASNSSLPIGGFCLGFEGAVGLG